MEERGEAEFKAGQVFTESRVSRRGSFQLLGGDNRIGARGHQIVEVTVIGVAVEVLRPVIGPCGVMVDVAEVRQLGYQVPVRREAQHHPV